MQRGRCSESNQSHVPGKSLNQSESPINVVREVKAMGEGDKGLVHDLALSHHEPAEKKTRFLVFSLKF